MTLPSWWQVTTPHKDIRDGKMSEAVFAADLGDVAYGKGLVEYKDPVSFFEKTFVTKGLKNLLENVFSKLGGGKGDAVIQLQTPFGGGKTHALLMLYHAVKHWSKVKHFEGVSDLGKKLNGAKVAVFVGTHADAISGRTPWGEIAYQLGQYEVVKEHDKKRISPGKEVFSKVLKASGPTLILMDEILEYIVKANRAEKLEKITHGQTLAFLQEITELVASSGNCCLVTTLPASILERYDEEAEKALQQLQKVSGRVETVYTPVEGVELYEVIRKRLFEDAGEEKTRRKAAQVFFEMYQKLGSDVPTDAREVEYRERIEHAYPFHPELIDVLYQRWGSYPTFQRTRGVLRLLAEVVADLYKRKEVSPLIQSSVINLDNQIIRREFVKHIGNEFDSVIASDIAGKSAKAPKIDKDMGSEYEKYGIAEGIATSVFLYSFSGAAKKETTLPRIRVALLREGIPPTIVGDAVAKLEEELWYFHSEKKQYSFKNQPNLVRVIADKEESVTEERILETLKALLQKNAGKAMEVYPWPEESSDIPDNKNLKLAILEPEHFFEESQKLISEFLEKAGIGFRVYKNTMFILLTDEDQYSIISKGIRRHLALSDIQADKDILATLTKESQDELKAKLKESEKEIPFKMLTGYRHLAFLGEKGIEGKDLGIPTIGTSQTVSERVRQYLGDHEKLLQKLTPKYILDKTFGKTEDKKPLKDIYELSLKTPGMPLLESERVLIDAVTEGVRHGILGLSQGTDIYYKEATYPSMDSEVLRGETAKALKEKQEQKEEKKEEGKKAGDIEVEEKKKEGVVRTVSMRAKVPWDKLSSIISGVILPLKDKGQPPEITIELEAESEDGFDRSTLDTKVKETLSQIGAKIEKWEEK
jgi:hypothetical protein